MGNTCLIQTTISFDENSKLTFDEITRVRLKSKVYRNHSCFNIFASVLSKEYLGSSIYESKYRNRFKMLAGFLGLGLYPIGYCIIFY